MPETRCSVCAQQHPNDYFQITTRYESNNPARRGNEDYSVRAVFECSQNHDPHRWPVTLHNGLPISMQPEMPVVASSDLSSGVLDGLVQDIKEAEEAHFHGLYKAAVVMCRRATQLALEPLVPNAGGQTLGPILGLARAMANPPLTQTGFLLADRVLSAGNAGAHHSVAITPREAGRAIEDAVEVLNEVAPELAKL